MVFPSPFIGISCPQKSFQKFEISVWYEVLARTLHPLMFSSISLLIAVNSIEFSSTSCKTPFSLTSYDWKRVSLRCSSLPFQGFIGPEYSFQNYESSVWCELLSRTLHPEWPPTTGHCLSPSVLEQACRRTRLVPFASPSCYRNYQCLLMNY